MADFVNTRDTMPGSTEDERARQAFDKLIAHELTEFKEDAVDYVRKYAFRNNKTLVNVELPTIAYNSSDSTRNSYMFQDCTALKNVKLKGMTHTPQYAFSGCTALESVEMSDNLNYINSYFLNNCPIAIFDAKNISDAAFVISSNAFSGSEIEHLILRSTKVAILSNINAFTDTPIINGEGNVYVPLALLDNYKNATNWSQIAASIYPIEEVNGEIVLRHFGTISDTWEQILAAEQDGTYSTKYNIGDTKTILVNGKSVIMQIAAFDADTIADSTEKAKISWVCNRCYGKNQKINNSSSALGGWPAMPIYTYLNDISSGVYSKIESTVKNAIKTVVKPYWDAAASVEKTSNDKLWLLSNQEVNFVTKDNIHKEEGGVTYSGLFPTASNSSDTSRIKYNRSNSASNWWWLRSSKSSNYFSRVNQYGGAIDLTSDDFAGVVFGFCT